MRYRHCGVSQSHALVSDTQVWDSIVSVAFLWLCAFSGQATVVPKKAQPLINSFPPTEGLEGFLPPVEACRDHCRHLLTAALLSALSHLSHVLQKLLRMGQGKATDAVAQCTLFLWGKAVGRQGLKQRGGFSRLSHQSRDAQSFSTLTRISRAPFPWAAAVAAILTVFLPSGYIFPVAPSSTWVPAQWLFRGPWTCCQKSSIQLCVSCNTCPGSWRFSSQHNLLRGCLKHWGESPECPMTANL